MLPILPFSVLKPLPNLLSPRSRARRTEGELLSLVVFSSDSKLRLLESFVMKVSVAEGRIVVELGQMIQVQREEGEPAPLGHAPQSMRDRLFEGRHGDAHAADRRRARGYRPSL